MSYRTIKNLKMAVKDVLCDIPETRNSDITLMIEIWRRHFPQRIFTAGDTKREYITLQSLYDLPREDNIKRVRAYWQNVKKIYLPTEETVAKARGINIDEWRVAMGYPTQQTAGTPTPSWKPQSEIRQPDAPEKIVAAASPESNQKSFI